MSMTCPYCGSSETTAKTKGFGLGKAAVGAAIAGPAGLLGGFIGSGKTQMVCLSCGKTWKPGDLMSVLQQDTDRRRREIEELKRKLDE